MKESAGHRRELEPKLRRAFARLGDRLLAEAEARPPVPQGGGLDRRPEDRGGGGGHFLPRGQSSVAKPERPPAACAPGRPRPPAPPPASRAVAGQPGCRRRHRAAPPASASPGRRRGR